MGEVEVRGGGKVCYSNHPASAHRMYCVHLREYMESAQ